MTDLKSQFDAAVAGSRLLTAKPDNKTLLEIYALFKQASTGDVMGERPDAFDRVAVAKYDAWEDLSGTAKDTAMQRYIDVIAKLRAG